MEINLKDITIEETRAQIACMLNELWHSRLPNIHWSNVVRNTYYVCYVFKYKEAINAIETNSKIDFKSKLSNDYLVKARAQLGEDLLTPKKFLVEDALHFATMPLVGRFANNSFFIH